MADMGFVDCERNIKLLEKNDGSTEKTIENLLGITPEPKMPPPVPPRSPYREGLRSSSQTVERKGKIVNIENTNGRSDTIGIIESENNGQMVMFAQKECASGVVFTSFAVGDKVVYTNNPTEGIPSNVKKAAAPLAFKPPPDYDTGSGSGSASASASTSMPSSTTTSTSTAPVLQKWSMELSNLAQMGLLDVKKNIYLLNKHKGNTELVVGDLFSGNEIIVPEFTALLRPPEQQLSGGHKVDPEVIAKLKAQTQAGKARGAAEKEAAQARDKAAQRESARAAIRQAEWGAAETATAAAAAKKKVESKEKNVQKKAITATSLTTVVPPALPTPVPTVQATPRLSHQPTVSPAVLSSQPAPAPEITSTVIPALVHRLGTTTGAAADAPIPQPPPPTTTPSAAAVRTADLEARIEELVTSNLALKHQNTTLQDKNATLKDKNTTLQDQNTTLQDQLQTSETKVARLTRRSARQWNIAADDIVVSTDDDNELGRGAFGVVKKGRWNGMDVAVKIISDHATAAQVGQAKKLLRNEARTLSYVKHANVMQFYGACTEPPMLVMMIAPNGNLRKLLDDFPALSALRRFHIARGICSGMVALHAQRILHLDLKPANIVLDADYTPLIADFGLALMQGGNLSVMSSLAGTTTIGGGGRGTEQYKAPELYDDDAPKYEQPADVYSFAMLMWELFTGEVPWSSLSGMQINRIHLKTEMSGDPNPKRPSLSDTSKDWHEMAAPAISTLIEQCWQQNPAARPGFAEMLHLLDDYARVADLPPIPNVGQLAAAAEAKAAALERQLADAEADIKSVELCATLSQHERGALAADVERLRLARDAARAERDAATRNGQVVEFPAEWTAQNDDGGDRSAYEWWHAGRVLVQVDAADAKWRWVEAQLKASLPNAVLTKLERWENRLQFRDYWTKRENITVKRGGAPNENEQWMWHGTSSLQPATALQHEVGLDPRFARRSFYGRGLYLAEKARYSNGDARKRYVYYPDHPDTRRRQLLLVRAAVGLPHDYGIRVDAEENRQGTRHLTKPPLEEASGKLFDSVKAGPHRPGHSGPGANDSGMVVLYDLAQAYPEYIVTYTI